MNLQEELKALKERIAELEEQLDQAREFPQDGDTYYCIESNGHTLWFQWDESTVDLQTQEIGNIFRTKEQAEFAVEKLKVEAELRKFSRPFDYERYNHFIKFHQDGTVEVHFDKSFQNQGTIYFESGERAIEAIKSVGKERIKKYIFGVED